MIALDESSLICDLAETYHVFNYRKYPVDFIATLANGLRDDSRIKMKARGVEHTLETVILAGMYDNIAKLLWIQTEDGRKGINMPESIVGILTGQDVKETTSYSSAEEYERARAEFY